MHNTRALKDISEISFEHTQYRSRVELERHVLALAITFSTVQVHQLLEFIMRGPCTVHQVLYTAAKPPMKIHQPKIHVHINITS